MKIRAGKPCVYDKEKDQPQISMHTEPKTAEPQKILRGMDTTKEGSPAFNSIDPKGRGTWLGSALLLFL